MRGEDVTGLLTKSDMLSIVETHVDAVLDTLRSVTPRASAMLPSEMLAFVALCIEKDVTHVVESGRKHGYSTEVLARCLPRCDVVSLECNPIQEAEARLAGYGNLRLLNLSMSKLRMRSLATGRMAVLLDGPKGQEAYGILETVLPDVVFGAIHDLSRNHPFRTGRLVGKDVWYTDDKEYVERYGHLDEFWITNGGYVSRSEMTADSFCLGFFKGGLW